MRREEEPEEKSDDKSDDETNEETDDESDEKSNEEHEEQPCASEEPAMSTTDIFDLETVNSTPKHPPKHTPEHTPKRARVSKSFLGRWKSHQDWTTFHTQKAAADFFNASQGTISVVLSGKKTHNKFELKY